MKEQIKQLEINAHKTVRSNKYSIEWHLNRPQSMGPIGAFIHDTNLSMILRIIRGVDAKSVLDVCCGSGSQLEYFERNGGRSIGIDISAEMCKIAKLRAIKHDLNYEVIVSDAENLPFKDNTFHFANCYQGLHHLPNPHIGISELCRVSRESIAFVEPIDALLRRILNKFGLFLTEYSGFKVHNFTQTEIIESLHRANFEEIKIVRYFDYFPKFLTVLNKKIIVKLYSLLCSPKNFILRKLGNQIVVTAFKR